MEVKMYLAIMIGQANNVMTSLEKQSKNCRELIRIRVCAQLHHAIYWLNFNRKRGYGVYRKMSKKAFDLQSFGVLSWWFICGKSCTNDTWKCILCYLFKTMINLYVHRPTTWKSCFHASLQRSKVRHPPFCWTGASLMLGQAENLAKTFK